MTRLVLRRLLWMLPGLVGLTFVVYAAARLTPGDALSMHGETLQTSAGANASVEAYRHLLGLDEPLGAGYLRWLSGAVRGDFGHSLHDGRTVAEKLGEALPVTVGLSGAALLLAGALAMLVGLLGAYRPGSRADRAATGLLFLLHAVPVPWAATMLVVLVGTRANLLPIHGLRSEGVRTVPDLLLHLVLPLVCLTYGALAGLSRYVRSAVTEQLAQEHARTARAKGVGGWSVVIRHGLRSALGGLAAVAGLMLPSLVGGSVLVERLFGLPGLGQLAFEAVLGKDLPVLMADTLLTGSVTMAGLLVSDLVGALFDPRLRSAP
jgi:peptide/nickel transport system permease protein